MIVIIPNYRIKDRFEQLLMSKYILALISLVLVSFGYGKTYAQQDLLDTAAAAYDSAHFQQAIDAYEQVAMQYGVNPELFYNLGNAYYKQKNYPKAILNYERCLLYDPSNVDARENVELARLQCVDKIEAIEHGLF